MLAPLSSIGLSSIINLTERVCVNSLQREGIVKQTAWMAVAGVAALAVVGCGGPGQTVPIAVTASMAPPPAKTSNALRVAVTPFEDLRSDKTAVGRWQHFVETTVDKLIPDKGTPADQVTDFVSDYLKLAGYQVTRLQAGQTAAPGSADIVLTGQIENYWGEAVGRFFRAELKAQNRLVIKAQNASDGSTVRTTVGGEGETKVVCFCPSDMEQLQSVALGESLARFLGDVVVVNRAFKPKN